MTSTAPFRLGVMIPDLGMRGGHRALKYLLLYQNTLQTSFEFHIVPVIADRVIDQLLPGQRTDRAEVEAAMPSFLHKCQKEIEQSSSAFGLHSEPNLPILILSVATFADNYFLSVRRGCAVIALGNWERHMAPPSIVEFFLTAAVKVAIDMACGRQFPSRHPTTKGCCFDFAAEIADVRYSELSGFICTKCLETITLARGDKFASDAQLLVKRGWLGTVAEPSDVSITAKKLGYDLFHVKGITPTWWENTRVILEEEGAKTLLKIGSAVIVAALIYYLGLKSK